MARTTTTKAKARTTAKAKGTDGSARKEQGWNWQGWHRHPSRRHHHGVTTTGCQRGCRCAKCVKAMRDYDRRARERRTAAAQAEAEKKAAKAARAKARRAAKKADPS
jgi:hypothetical protein